MEVEVMSPINLLVKGSKRSIGVAPPAYGYIFVNDDGVKVFCNRQKISCRKNKKVFALGRALTWRGKSYFWAAKDLRITRKSLRTSVLVLIENQSRSYVYWS